MIIKIILKHIKHIYNIMFPLMHMHSFYDILKHLYKMLIFSMPATILISFLSGFIIMLNINCIISIHSGVLSGLIIVLGGFRDLFPLLALISTVSYSGTYITTKISYMRFNKEYDMIIILGINPYYFLLRSINISILISTPIIVITSNIIGLLGAYYAGVYQMNISSGILFKSILINIHTIDIIIIFIKGLIFGFIISIFSTYEGIYNKNTGIYMIQSAVSNAISKIIIWGCIINFIISYIFYS